MADVEMILKKKREIELVLDIRVTEWMVKELGIYWKAFYDDPFTFRGTVVVQMVKQYIYQRMDDAGEVLD